jgi:hypothetical protein
MNEPTTQRPDQEPTEVQAAESATPIEAEDDVEGHNLMTGELARTVDREHRSEADRAVASGRRRREMKPRKSLRDRLFGR